MPNPLQPSFSISINGQDVTHNVDFGVTYDERADLITTLDFTLKQGAYYLEALKPGLKVVLTGGTLNKKRVIFNGIIKKMASIFPNEGDVRVAITAYDTVWGDAAANKKMFVYPQKSSSRTWADKPTITVKEVIENIVSEMGADLNLVLPDGANKSYGLKKPLSQNMQSDWAFLRGLAKLYGCFIWTDVQGPTLIINFVDRSKVANYSAKTTFVYPLRDSGNFIYSQQTPNQLILRDVSVEEDVQAADANMRVVTKFDDTGHEISLISKTVEKDGKHYIYYYQLDEKKVEALQKNNPKEADRLINMGMFGIPPEEFLKYYNTVEYVEDNVAVYAQVFIGITVNCSSDGNVDIKSQQAYDLKGIARYSTNERSGKFYLRALKFVWDEDGMHNEYEFMK